MDPRSIGTVLTALRESKGLTQAQLAKRSRVSRGYLADLEAGHRTNPSVPTLRRLAKALGVLVASLMDHGTARVEVRRFDPQRVFPPTEDFTKLIFRLMMAADDVRCSRNIYMEAEQRLEGARGVRGDLISGQKWYALRLLFSHLHEGGDAMRELTRTISPQQIERSLAGQPEAVTAFRHLRATFEVAKPERMQSFIWKLRNWIGFHNDGLELRRVYEKYGAYVTGAVTASERAGLTRFLIADSLTILVFLDAAGANLPSAAGLDQPGVRAKFDAEVGQAVKRVSEEALLLAGDLTHFVDALAHAHVQERGIDSIEQNVIEIPARLRAARAAVDAGRYDSPPKRRKAHRRH
jgi:transcriptional regulator with XRE-family HTH domain